jgi:Protein of unknown function (DUF998)
VVSREVKPMQGAPADARVPEEATSSQPPQSPLAPGPRRALTLAVAGIALYVVLDVIAQLLPPHYSPISQAESDLAVGPYGYVMAVNFVVRGALTFAFLFGLVGATRLGRTARVGLSLLVIWGAGAFVLAAFPTDVSTMVTVHGMIHNTTAAVAFTGGAFGALLLSAHFHAEERLHRLGTTAWILAVLGVVVYFATLAALVFHRLSSVFGLIERLFIGLVLLWILVVALQLLLSDRRSSATTAA